MENQEGSDYQLPISPRRINDFPLNYSILKEKTENAISGRKRGDRGANNTLCFNSMAKVIDTHRDAGVSGKPRIENLATVPNISLQGGFRGGPDESVQSGLVGWLSGIGEGLATHCSRERASSVPASAT
jgi:hypothetical protein